jgi:hypothetical protein
VKKSEEVFDLTRIFAEEILRRPAKLFEFIHSLKDECIMASNELPNNYSSDLQANIKSLFENETSKNLREKVFSSKLNTIQYILRLRLVDEFSIQQ